MFISSRLPCTCCRSFPLFETGQSHLFTGRIISPTIIPDSYAAHNVGFLLFLVIFSWVYNLIVTICFILRPLYNTEKSCRSTDDPSSAFAAAFTLFFYLIFYKYQNKTPTEFINDIRIANAKLALEYTNRSILQICEEVGFDNTSHFYHLFKKDTGLSPKAFRELSSEVSVSQAP